MQSNANHKKFCLTLIIPLLTLLLTMEVSELWGGEEIQLDTRPIIDQDSSTSEEVSPEKKAKSEPVLRPGPEGKQLIGNRKGNPSWGKMIFEKHCYYCHGKKGLGDGPIVIGLEVSPPSYIRENGILYMTDQEIFDTITYGRKTHASLYMPPWGPSLSAMDRISVIAYIKQLAKKTKEEMEEKKSQEGETP